MTRRLAHDIVVPTTRSAPGVVTNTGANPERHARVMALRSSSAASPHRNRRREAVRGLGKGGRAGAKQATRLLEDER